MKTVFGLKNIETAKKLVRDYIRNELYPDVEIEGARVVDGVGEDFDVRVLASTGVTNGEDYRIYLTTDLPDGMLYEVVQLVTEEQPHLTAYKNINAEEEPAE